MFSAFNPSKCTHLEQWAADCATPGEQSWTSFQSRDSNPQPWVTSGFKSNALSNNMVFPEASVQIAMRSCTCTSLFMLRKKGFKFRPSDLIKKKTAAQASLRPIQHHNILQESILTVY